MFEHVVYLLPVPHPMGFLYSNVLFESVSLLVCLMCMLPLYVSVHFLINSEV